MVKRKPTKPRKTSQQNKDKGSETNDTDDDHDDGDDEVDQHISCSGSPLSINSSDYSATSETDNSVLRSDASFTNSPTQDIASRHSFSPLSDTNTQSSPPPIKSSPKSSHLLESKTPPSVKYFCFVAIPTLLLVLYCVYFPQQDSTIKEQPNQFEEFVKKIENLKSIFPSQEQRLWRTIKASGGHVLNVTNPDYPAVLLFFTKSDPIMDGRFDASSCLARKISSEFDAINKMSSDSSPMVDCGELDAKSSKQEKLNLDNKLHYYLDRNFKTVIIEHLELLSPTAALMLHSYCDGENAPYKDVMFILIFHVKNGDLNPRSAELLLKTSWEKELRSDKVDALMSRVANNIVIVNPESNTLSSHCV